MSTLYLICGKIGSGKTYISKRMEEDLGIRRLRKITTRPRRDGETNDEYIFVDKEEFNKYKLNKNILLESSFRTIGTNSESAIWRYGVITPSKIESNDDCFAVVDSQMIYNERHLNDVRIKCNADYLKIIYISADTEVRLRRCIEREDNPNYAEICRRILVECEEYKEFEQGGINPWGDEYYHVYIVDNSIQYYDDNKFWTSIAGMSLKNVFK